MKLTEYCHKNSDVVAFIRFENENVYFEIKNKEVTEEEFNEFIKH